MADAAGAGGNAAGESGWKARIESARLEKTRNQPGRAYRELYRQLYRVLDAGAADAGIPGTAAAANTAGAAGAARTSSPARGAIRTGDVIQDDETGRNDDDQRHQPRTIRIGLVSISDRASQGVYQDQGLPALQDWLGKALTHPVAGRRRG